MVAHVAALKAELREVGAVGRFGGEKFLAPIPGATVDTRPVSGRSAAHSATHQRPTGRGRGAALLGQHGRRLVARASGGVVAPFDAGGRRALPRKAAWPGLRRCGRRRYRVDHPSGGRPVTAGGGSLPADGQSWDRHLPSFRADDGHALCYLCHCGDCARDERGAATSDRGRFQRRRARGPDGVRGRSSHRRRCRGRTRRAADVRRRPEIDRETPCRCRCPAPSAEDRSETPVDRISGRRHLRGRHPAHRSRCRPGIFAEQHQDGDQAEIGIQQALSRPRRYCDAYDRGRDARYRAPPAQIRTCPIRAYGSYLGCLTANMPYTVQPL
jgi:hypothetical protein